MSSEFQKRLNKRVSKKYVECYHFNRCKYYNECPQRLQSLLLRCSLGSYNSLQNAHFQPFNFNSADFVYLYKYMIPGNIDFLAYAHGNHTKSKDREIRTNREKTTLILTFSADSDHYIEHDIFLERVASFAKCQFNDALYGTKNVEFCWM